MFVTKKNKKKNSKTERNFIKKKQQKLFARALKQKELFRYLFWQAPFLSTAPHPKVLSQAMIASPIFRACPLHATCGVFLFLMIILEMRVS